MTEYKVEEVLSRREWTPTGETQPKKVYYDLNLIGVAKTVNLGRHPSQPAVEAGQTLNLTLTDEGKAMKATEPRQGGGGFGGGGRPKDPAERRSIAMQHAQKCAVTILEVAAAHGDYKPPNAGDVANQVKTIAAILWQQVNDAEAGA